ncbi:MAG: thiamine phosphate synthase [Granulosicoccaceae bacterium]|jgi:thiamine-phosphate pyrophosphorylase
MSSGNALRGLYVITDDALAGERVAEQVEAALRGGARLVQYRSKQGTPSQREQQARAVLATCHAHGVPLLVNDDPQLAKTIGADGVHLGQSDVKLAAARELLGPGAIIGVTCHASVELAVHAAQGGASYVAFGRFFPSQTKPGAPPADINVLREAKARLTIPICAIGGITPANAPALLEAGADLLAVIHGVFGQPDIEAAARCYAKLFDSD